VTVRTIKLECDNTEVYGGEIVLVSPAESDDGDVRIMVRRNGQDPINIYANLPSLNAFGGAIGQILVDSGVTMRMAVQSEPAAERPPSLLRRVHAYQRAQELIGDMDPDLRDIMELAKWLAGDD
jgi:hypothetical protein